MKKFLSLVLALVMMMSLVTVSAGAKEFADDGEIQYEEAVSVISEIKVVDGYENGNFGPKGTLTRGAAAKIICNLILGPTTAAELKADTVPYSDVPTNHVFAGYIAFCAKEGIISGYADGTFRPAGTLTGYAFMKMLLGALGYDSDYEQYVGANWSINVAKQAIGIGLNAGLKDDFDGADYVTREEAALYAFNTLKSTMVAYDSKISANVNGAEVTISNSNAKPITWKEGINKDGNIKRDGFVQFAEEYFPKLIRKDDTDIFMRPANTWVNAKREIGTYADYTKLVETYTAGVSGKEVYELLGSVVVRDNELESHLDGAEGPAEKSMLARSKTSDLPGTGTGVLTEVYLDVDKDLITIVSVNTYLAQATADYSESKEYALAVYVDSGKNTDNYNVDVIDVAEVEDVEKDGWYLVNISYKDSIKGDIVTIMDAEVLEDSTVTKFSRANDDNENDTVEAVTSLTTGGTKYSANEKALYDEGVLGKYSDGLLSDMSYNVYLDQYGNFIGVDVFSGAANYVFITGYDLSSSNLVVKTGKAAAIFLDGTMDEITVNVRDTNKNIEKMSDTHDTKACYTEWAPNAGVGVNGRFEENRWYTYTKSESGVYTLKPAERVTFTQYATGKVIDTANLDVKGDWENLTRVYGEDESVYLTVEEDVVDTTNGNLYAITDVTGMYTGVQSVDLEILASKYPSGSEIYTVYDSDYYIIGAIVMGEAKGNTANIVYALGNAKSEEKIGDTYYWEFDVVMGGEIQTVTAKSKYPSTIDVLEDEIKTGDRILELRFDGDYVVTIKDVTKGIYGNDELADDTIDVKGYDVYDVNANDFELNLKGRTMYVTAGRTDVGLALISDAKAVVIQKENGKTVKTEFTSVSGALGHLAEPAGKDEIDGQQYDGRIIAAVNSKGAADWVVFVNDSELVTGNNKPSKPGDNDGAVRYVEVDTVLNKIVLNEKDKSKGNPETVYDAALRALASVGYKATGELDTSNPEKWTIRATDMESSNNRDFPFAIVWG